MSTPDWRNWVLGMVAAGAVAFCGWMTISVSGLSGDTRAMRESIERLREDMQEFARIQGRLAAVEKHATIIGEAYAEYVPWKKEVDRRLNALERSNP